MMRRMKYWQKGVFFALIFVFILGLIYSLIFMAIDLGLESKNLPHLCYGLKEVTVCTFGNAIVTKIGFLFVFFLVFGVPLAIIGGLLGYIFDKIRIS